MSLRLRSAEPADVDGIREVATRAWHRAHEPIIGAEAVEAFLEEYYDDASFRARMDDADALVDVAVEHGDVVGFVLAAPAGDDGTTFNLNRLYVAPDRWGEGVGRRLLERVERAVRERDGERVELGVMAENDRAVRFYEAAGYRRTGEFYDDRIDARGYTYAKAVE